MVIVGPLVGRLAPPLFSTTRLRTRCTSALIVGFVLLPLRTTVIVIRGPPHGVKVATSPRLCKCLVTPRVPQALPVPRLKIRVALDPVVTPHGVSVKHPRVALPGWPVILHTLLPVSL